MGTAVKYLRDRLEAVLARRIPNLQFEDLLLELYEQSAELDADGDLVILYELVVSQAMQHARFSNRRVAYDDQLEQEVLIRDRLVFKDLVRHLRKPFHRLLLALALYC